MLAPVTHILPLTLIRRERLLPGIGKILVRKGQKVHATDIIAETRGKQEFSVINVTRSLGVSADHLEKYLQCNVGSQLVPGDVIAGPVGLTKRVLRATKKGKVVLIGEGQVFIELENHPLSIYAGLPGEVTELISDRGVVIETTGALIQGVWGNGRLSEGVLSVLATSTDHVLEPGALDASYQGKIILAGHCGSAEALKAAEQASVKGIILSSLSLSLVGLALNMHFPLILLEGFGKFPMNAATFKLLSTHDQREVTLNAEMHSSQRPEVIIPLPVSPGLAQPRRTDFFTAKQRVRVCSSLHARESGVVLRLKGTVTMPSGIRVQAAEIQLDSGEKVVLPLANLEILA